VLTFVCKHVCTCSHLCVSMCARAHICVYACVRAFPTRLLISQNLLAKKCSQSEKAFRSEKDKRQEKSSHLHTGMYVYVHASAYVCTCQCVCCVHVCVCMCMLPTCSCSGGMLPIISLAIFAISGVNWGMPPPAWHMEASVTNKVHIIGKRGEYIQLGTHDIDKGLEQILWCVVANLLSI